MYPYTHPVFQELRESNRNLNNALLLLQKEYNDLKHRHTQLQRSHFHDPPPSSHSVAYNSTHDTQSNPTHTPNTPSSPPPNLTSSPPLPLPTPLPPTIPTIDTTTIDPSVLAVIQSNKALLQNLIQSQHNTSSLHQLQIKELEQARKRKPLTHSTLPKLTNSSSSISQFPLWYKEVLSILATEEWQDLYDPTTRDVIDNGFIHAKLNEHLYSAILQCVRDEPRILVQDLDYLWGDSVSLLRALKNTYQGNLTTLEILQLQGELLNPTIHLRALDKSVDSYAARTLRMHRELQSNNVSIQPEILKACFICGLVPEFTEIIKQLNNHNLPLEWQSTPIIQLIEPARQVLRLARQQRAHNANYKAIQKYVSKDTSKDTSTPSNHAPLDKDKDRQARIAKAIFNDTFKISDFEKDITKGHCVYHNTPHGDSKDPSNACYRIKNLLGKRQQQKLNQAPTSNPTTSPPSNPQNPSNPRANQATTTNSHPQDDQELAGTLSNLTVFVDNHNNINETKDEYFRISCNSVTLRTTTNPTDITIIDSGAFPMMFNSPQYFYNLQPWTHTSTCVTLADGKTKAVITGVGTARFSINNKYTVEFDNAILVPTLSSNLFSIKSFIQYYGTHMHAENNTITLALPTFITDAHITDEIFIHTNPSTNTPVFSSTTATLIPQPFSTPNLTPFI